MQHYLLPSKHSCVCLRRERGGLSEIPAPMGDVLPERRKKPPFIVWRWLTGGIQVACFALRNCTIKWRKPTPLSSADGCTSRLRGGIGSDQVNHSLPLISCHQFGDEGIEFTVAECLCPGERARSPAGAETALSSSSWDAADNRSV